MRRPARPPEMLVHGLQPEGTMTVAVDRGNGMVRLHFAAPLPRNVLALDLRRCDAMASVLCESAAVLRGEDPDAPALRGRWSFPPQCRSAYPAARNWRATATVRPWCSVPVLGWWSDDRPMLVVEMLDETGEAGEDIWVTARDDCERLDSPPVLWAPLQAPDAVVRRST